MPTKGQKVRLGIFIVLTLSALLVLLALITRQKFLQKQDYYYIAYENVSVGGLEVGSPVKYLGIKVGVVDDISIDPENVNRVIVKVALKEGTPIKADAEALIAAIGITGLKTIEIRGGTNEAPLLKPGEYIPAGTSITEEITGRAEVISEKLEQVINNLQVFTRPENLNKITQFAEKSSHTFEQIDQLVTENRQQLRLTLLQTQRVTARLDTTMELLQETASDIHRIVGSDTLGQILANTRAVSLKLKEADLVALIGQLREVAERTNRLLILMDHGIERGGVDWVESMRKLKIASGYLEEFSRILQEDPSVLIRGTKIKNAPDKELE